MAALAHDMAEHKRECLAIRRETNGKLSAVDSKVEKVLEVLDSLNKVGWRIVMGVLGIFLTAFVAAEATNYVNSHAIADKAVAAATQDTNQRAQRDAKILKKLDRIAPDPS